MIYKPFSAYIELKVKKNKLFNFQTGHLFYDCHNKKLGQRQQKTKVVQCSQNTCLELSTGEQVH